MGLLFFVLLCVSVCVCVCVFILTVIKTVKSRILIGVNLPAYISHNGKPEIQLFIDLLFYFSAIFFALHLTNIIINTLASLWKKKKNTHSNKQRICRDYELIFAAVYSTVFVSLSFSLVLVQTISNVRCMSNVTLQTQTYSIFFSVIITFNFNGIVILFMNQNETK